MDEQAHEILLVEDQEDVARVLEKEITRRGYRCMRAADRATALRYLEEESLCGAVLDLVIPEAAGDPDADEEVGFAVLERIAALFPAKNESRDCHLFPRVISSANAATTDNAVRAIRSGADDFYNKSVKKGGRSLGDILAHVLARSGRKDHSKCGRLNRLAKTPPDPARLVLTDEIRDKRIVVRFDGRPIPLREASLRVLLHMIHGRLTVKNGYVHKRDMGARDEGWVGYARLCRDVRDADQDVDPDAFFQKDGHGRFRVRKKISLGTPDTDAIRDLDLDDSAIKKLLDAIDAVEPIS